MVELRLVGLSEDRQRLILHSVTGQEFSVVVDDRLRAALRGDRARLGQLEIQMDSALRPRDIQARIRAGESPESVAEVAQCSVDKILGYAVPVLAERQHLAERAQRSAIRRKGGDGPGRLLGDAVEERLRLHHVDPETAEWDAWRREDGKWTVTVSHRATTEHQTATFTFDALGRYVVAEDDPARWLLGETPAAPVDERPEQHAGQGTRPVRRLAAVSDHRVSSRQAGHRQDDPSLFEDDEGGEFDDDLAAVADAVGNEAQSAEDASARDAADADGERAGSRPTVAEEEEPADPPAAEVEAAGAQAPREEPKRRGRKSRGRASVPSWDEIMFGRTKD
jgi:Protein of unknown function (DUF3071)